MSEGGERTVPNRFWNLTIRDCVGSQPFAVVDEILLAVRTPRSRSFVTLEVGLLSENPLFEQESPCPGDRCCSSPPPWISKGWFGEVSVGENGTVALDLAGRTFLITLKEINEIGLSPPWASYEFLLQEEDPPRGGPVEAI